ncbi:MAG: protein phosphatase 2C domain-containing protein [Muribaculaceae bacterium]|nr:protein phosphatase 2C domain-containing protein [Muribaculaceae bacterium]
MLSGSLLVLFSFQVIAQMTGSRFSASFFGATNQGMVRTNNEDTYICRHIWDESHILCAAIDGLGGYEGGEIAAELARTTIIKHLEDFPAKKTGEMLKASLIAANNEIIHQHESRPKVSRMGCVASVGIIDLSQGVISIAHVGDSRIYQFVNGELKKLTHDHSLVGYREETGELSEEDAMNHPRRNVIDRFLGDQALSFDSDGYVEVSVWPITGDTQYLFCSDGLTDLITSGQISRILSSEHTVEEKTEAFISSANEAGGKDNITVVLTDIRANVIESPENERNIQEPTTGKGPLCRRRFILGLISGVILGSAVMYVFQRLVNDSNEAEIRTQTHKQGPDYRKNTGLELENTIPEDSIAKQTAADKTNHADLKSTDNHSPADEVLQEPIRQ